MLPVVFDGVDLGVGDIRNVREPAAVLDEGVRLDYRGLRCSGECFHIFPTHITGVGVEKMSSTSS